MSRKVIFDEDNPEWTEEDFKEARSPEGLPPEVLAAFPRTKLRGPQKAPRKVPVSLRLSPEVVAHYRATGPGWQRRIDDDLKKAAGLRS
jgi:uncharacterized protein (DUF4415 family)